MKIDVLRLRNIHSLRGDHTVDFSSPPLADAGIFAITGPTGAGKSTLLDAITLALYRRIPRSKGLVTDSSITQEGIILTQHTEDCYAEVDFSVKGNRYRAHWSIAKTRTGNNFRAARHELINLDDDSIICDRFKDTSQMTENLVGLSYDQFVKAMVLAQGQFALLLHASAEDRNKLLEDITGGQIYREIGRKVYDRYKSERESVEQLQMKRDAISLLDDEVRSSKLALEKNTADIIKQEEAALQVLLKTIERKLQIKKLLVNLENTKNEKIEFQQQLKTWTIDEKRLNTHDSLVAFREPLLKIDRLAREISQSKSQCETLTERMNKAKKERQNAESEASKILKEDVVQNEIDEQLQTFRKQVDAYDKAISDETLRLKHAQKQQDDAEILLRKRLGNFTSNAEQNATYWVQRIGAKQSDLGITKGEDAQKQLRKLENRVGVLNDYRSAQTIYTLQKEALAEVQNTQQANAKAYEENGLKCNELKILLELEQPKQKALKERIESRRKAASLEEQRHELTDGEPCPLCGAIHHPYAEGAPQINDQLENELKALTQRVEECNRDLLLVNQRIQEFEIEADKNASTLAKKRNEVDSAKNNLNEHAHALKWPMDKSEDHINTAAAELKQKKDILQQFARELDCLDELNAFDERSKKIRHQHEKINSLTAERTSIYTGNNVADKVSSILKRHGKATQTYKDTASDLKEKQRDQLVLMEDHQRENDALLLSIAKHNIKTLDDLKQRILSETDAAQLRNKKREIEAKKERLAAEHNTIQKQLSTLDDNDKRNLPECLIHKTEQSVKLDQRKDENAELRAELKQDESNRKEHQRISDIIKQTSQQLNVWRTLNDLIGDARGKTFAAYVQTLTLKQLLNYANQQLETLSDRYKLQMPEGDNLQVEDRHLGNTQRSVASLSGGETFKISLALALGLSDLAAQNVRIDSLFIDEGFGTLDNDSLNDAIATLEELQSRDNKSIGIISHVGELKDRIGARINVVPTGNGYSRVSVGS